MAGAAAVPRLLSMRGTPTRTVYVPFAVVSTQPISALALDRALTPPSDTCRNAATPRGSAACGPSSSAPSSNFQFQCPRRCPRTKIDECRSRAVSFSDEGDTNLDSICPLQNEREAPGQLSVQLAHASVDPEHRNASRSRVDTAK